MGIFGRMKTLMKANVNDLASKAENPERVLNQLIRDMEDQLTAAKMQVRDTIADQKRLEKQLEQAQASAAEWERKAMTAINADRDDLAREALGRKQEADEQCAQYQSNLELQRANAEELKGALRQLAAKVEEAQRKKNVLIARQKRVEATNQMSTTATATSNTSAFESFERSAAKIENFEAEVEAHAEISETVKADDLDRRLHTLEEKHGADDALAELKAKMAQKND